MTDHYGFDPATGAPLYAGSGAPVYAAGSPVTSSSSAPSTEGSPVSRPCPMTAGDLFMSLNGFDEIAVASHFGAPIAALREDAVTLGRALAFVHQRRIGLADREAYAAAMGLTIQTISHAYFAPEPEKAEPASAEGNGGA